MSLAGSAGSTADARGRLALQPRLLRHSCRRPARLPGTTFRRQKAARTPSFKNAYGRPPAPQRKPRKSTALQPRPFNRGCNDTRRRSRRRLATSPSEKAAGDCGSAGSTADARGRLAATTARSYGASHPSSPRWYTMPEGRSWKLNMGIFGPLGGRGPGNADGGAHVSAVQIQGGVVRQKEVRRT